MRTIIAADPTAMGKWVAERAATDLCQAISARGEANLVVATGASQFEVLASLTQQTGVDWSKVTAFHLDEYVGLSPAHPASFCRYLQERFVEKVALAEFHYLRGDRDPRRTMAEVGERLAGAKIDVGLVGIGVNGHLAFNDPPADFKETAPYLLVDLDRQCRQQQVDEGWFDTIGDVPTRAISMSIQQILRCNSLYCSVPGLQKAEAVRATLQGEVSPEVPASILKTHGNCTLVIDHPSSEKLDRSRRVKIEHVA